MKAEKDILPKFKPLPPKRPFKEFIPTIHQIILTGAGGNSSITKGQRKGIPTSQQNI